MELLYALLFALSLLCFIVAAAQTAGPARLGAVGLALWVTVLLIGAVRAV